MIIVILLSLFLYYILFKIWSSGVKAVGRAIVFVVKPIYKFLFRVFPITVAIATVLVALLTVGLGIGMVVDSDKNDTDKESNELLEMQKGDDRNLLERFGDRAIKRVEDFGDFLVKKAAVLNETIGFDENGDYKGATGFLILYTFMLLILLPFLLMLLITALLFVSMIELLMLTFIVDIVILIIRLIRNGEVLETIKDWWDWAIY